MLCLKSFKDRKKAKLCLSGHYKVQILVYLYCKIQVLTADSLSFGTVYSRNALSGDSGWLLSLSRLRPQYRVLQRSGVLSMFQLPVI